MSVHVLRPEQSEQWEPYLAKRDIAQRLGFSVRWLEQQVSTGGLPAHMIGGQRRFLWSEVVEWVQHRDELQGGGTSPRRQGTSGTTP